MLKEMTRTLCDENQIVYEEVKKILHALIGGARYGLKIRTPHAIVMTFLFRRDLSCRKKIQTVLRMTLEHSTNLAAFAAVYKIVLAILKHISIKRGKNVSHGTCRKRNVFVWLY